MTMYQAQLLAAWTCGMMPMAPPVPLALLPILLGIFSMMSKFCKMQPSKIFSWRLLVDCFGCVYKIQILVAVPVTCQQPHRFVDMKLHMPVLQPTQKCSEHIHTPENLHLICTLAVGWRPKLTSWISTEKRHMLCVNWSRTCLFNTHMVCR